MQSSDLAVARINSWFTQFERHQAHMGTHRDDRASESESQLAEWALVVERFGCDRSHRRLARQRVSVSRDGDLRVGRDDLVRRRPYEDQRKETRDASQA